MKIKILQLNFYWGGWFWDNLIEFIKKEDPDIITAQEVYNSNVKDLPPNFSTMSSFQEIFDYPYTFFTPEFLHVREEGKFDQGNAIFSKFPILKKDSQHFIGKYQEWSVEKGIGEVPRSLQHARIDANNNVFNLFNLHGPVDNRGDYDSLVRLEMSEFVVNKTRDKKNVVLAGDFNVSPNTKTIVNIEKNLKNVFKDELKSTFNMRRKDDPGFANAAVDMIFVSPNIKISNHYCPDVDISDHYPLVAMLEV